MATLDELIRGLLDRYAEDDGRAGPGLLRRLDDPALRTSQPHQSGGHAPPGSRPPTPLEAVHWSQRIKTEAVALDMELRGSPYAQPWEKALRALPPNAEASGRVGETAHLVGLWYSTAQTVLGLRSPSVYFAYVRCLACGERTIYGRADEDRPRAWCVNDACVDEYTGRPARYEGERVYLLTANWAC
ncbi:hypothetical protein ADL21_11300 [Streptomyces albus subsp. albus]|nr:hypothetical protein ADL21_11300 [Streptomyces albus subsp. albus]